MRLLKLSCLCLFAFFSSAQAFEPIHIVAAPEKVNSEYEGCVWAQLRISHASRENAEWAAQWAIKIENNNTMRDATLNLTCDCKRGPPIEGTSYECRVSADRMIVELPAQAGTAGATATSYTSEGAGAACKKGAEENVRVFSALIPGVMFSEPRCHCVSGGGGHSCKVFTEYMNKEFFEINQGWLAKTGFKPATRQAMVSAGAQGSISKTPTTPALVQSAPIPKPTQPAPLPAPTPVIAPKAPPPPVSFESTPKGKQCRAIEVAGWQSDKKYMDCYSEDQRQQDAAIKQTEAYAQCQVSKTMLCPRADMILSHRRCASFMQESKAAAARLRAECGTGGTGKAGAGSRQ